LIVRDELIVELQLELVFVFLFVLFDLKPEADAWSVLGPAILAMHDVRVKLFLAFECPELEIADRPIKPSKLTKVCLETD